MTQEEIIEGNILIGKFHDPTWEGRWGGDEDNICRYHSSWDYLMPVVEKIEQVSGNGFHLKSNSIGFEGETEVVFRYFTHSYSKDNKEIRIIHETKIVAVRLAVVEFIKWFNLQKSEKNLIKLILKTILTMKKQVTIFPNNIDITVVGDQDSGELALWWGNGIYLLYFDEDDSQWLFDIDETFLLQPEDLESGFKTPEEAINVLKNRISTNINETLIELK